MFGDLDKASTRLDREESRVNYVIHLRTRRGINRLGLRDTMMTNLSQRSASQLRVITSGAAPRPENEGRVTSNGEASPASRRSIWAH